MIKQASTVGYVSISGRKIAAILLILICSFALAWATRSGKGNKSDTSVKPAQPLMAHTNQARIGGRSVHHATHNHSTAAGKEKGPRGDPRPFELRVEARAYRAARAGAAAGCAFFFSARSSSQIVIGAAMNQLE